MRLLAPPRARLLWGLMLLTLLLGAVCGIRTKSQERYRNRPKYSEENVQVRENQKPAGKARDGSARLAPNGILWSKFRGGDKMVIDEALPEDSRTPEDTGDIKQNSGTRKPRMRSRRNQGPDPGVPAIDKISGGDTCDKWMSCNGGFFLQYLKFMEQELPSCPCRYPGEAIQRVVTLFDERLDRWFQWRDASRGLDHMHMFHPSASLCLLSLLPENSSTLASQHCCYDRHLRLLTRGKGAGSPMIINPDYSPALHFMVDRVPWITCKGDWSRYHKMLPPNNGLSCPQRPSKKAYQTQLQKASKSHGEKRRFFRRIDWEKVDMNE